MKPIIMEKLQQSWEIHSDKNSQKTESNQNVISIYQSSTLTVFTAHSTSRAHISFQTPSNAGHRVVSLLNKPGTLIYYIYVLYNEVTRAVPLFHMLSLKMDAKLINNIILAAFRLGRILCVLRLYDKKSRCIHLSPGLGSCFPLISTVPFECISRLLYVHSKECIGICTVVARIMTRELLCGEKRIRPNR